ncbi:MAG: 1-acyl-sn-glycerol-3-phosphate acyltransferase [Parcubacteria group bacterium]|jgi:1-acyl-sn-glycerol-3-phosphate acyltransferase|nr:1-acyl-sn-glycerol-3-phosphate acyltransferase [Parcubacteria group bacterium]
MTSPQLKQNNPKEKEWKESIFLRLSYSFLKATLGTLIRLIWVKKVEGLENIPKKGSVIIAFNHQSIFDFLCFIPILPRHIHYLSAEKFFSHPVWTPLVKMTGQIKVDRVSRDKSISHQTLYKYLANNKVIGIYPEGTRSPFEKEMLYAFTGVAKYAINAQVPVIPVGIKGTYEIMSRHDKKPKFKKLATFHIGKPIDFTKYQSANLNKKAYRVLTDRIMMEISKLSGKTYPYYGKFKTKKPKKTTVETKW